MPHSIARELLGAYAELKRWLASRLGNAQDAADIAQSSFERVFAYSATGRVISARGLLFHTARGLCVDQGRRRRLEARVLEAISADAPSTAPSAEHAAAQRQALERIVARLTRLPRKRRDAFTLVRIYGHSHAEAAAHLRVTVAAVEKHVVRATLDCADLFQRLAS